MFAFFNRAILWFSYKFRFFYFFKMFFFEVESSRSWRAMRSRIWLYWAYAVDYYEYSVFCYKQFINRSYEDNNFDKFNSRIWEEDFKQLKFDILRFIRNMLLFFIKSPGEFLYPIWLREKLPIEFTFWKTTLKSFFKEIRYIARDVFWSLYYMDYKSFNAVFRKKENVEESKGKKEELKGNNEQSKKQD